MRALGFDRDQYLALQSEHIEARRQQFGGKLYLEFGGKLFDDLQDFNAQDFVNAIFE